MINPAVENEMQIALMNDDLVNRSSSFAKKSRSGEVSVVILTRNSERTLPLCLRHVLSEHPAELVAIDAQSTDDTLSILMRASVRTIVDYHRSLGSARQLGIESAKGDLVMFVDSDVQLQKNCIGTLVSDMHKFGWVGIHARLLSSENVSYWQKGQDEAYSDYYSTVGPRDRIDTIAAMFKRDVLLKYQFDPFFKESSEDVDICRRLTAARQTLGASGAVAFHYHRRSFRDFVKQRFRNGIGTSRLSIKYEEKMILIEPLETAASLVVRNVLSKKFSKIPYFVVSGVAEFIGVLYGIFKIRNEMLLMNTGSANLEGYARRSSQADN